MPGQWGDLLSGPGIRSRAVHFLDSWTPRSWLRALSNNLLIYKDFVGFEPERKLREQYLSVLAVRRGLGPLTLGVTGRYSNQLN